MEKKMTFKKLISGLLSTLLTLLGFASCNSGEDEPYVMYAPGPAFYRIKGKVVEKGNTENALSGIQVVAYPILENGEKELTRLADTLFTDTNGQFRYEDFPHDTIRLIFEDANLPEGKTSFGIFAKDTLDIDLSELTREERNKGITVELQKIKAEQSGNNEKEQDDQK